MGPRTPVVSTMQRLFWIRIRISSTSGFSSAMIVLDNVLEIRIELIKRRNDNVMEKFYLMHTILKNQKCGRKFETLETYRKYNENAEGGAPALRGIRAGTRLTAHLALPLLTEIYKIFKI